VTGPAVVPPPRAYYPTPAAAFSHPVIGDVMPAFSRDPWPSSALTLPHVLADRTTRREGGPAADDTLAVHLRVVIARVLRTGRGPGPLVSWVRREMTARPPQADDAAGQLAERLLGRLVPPTPTHLCTVGG
jgi:hypothetical protein